MLFKLHRIDPCFQWMAYNLLICHRWKFVSVHGFHIRYPCTHIVSQQCAVDIALLCVESESFIIEVFQILAKNKITLV